VAEAETRQSQADLRGNRETAEADLKASRDTLAQMAQELDRSKAMMAEQGVVYAAESAELTAQLRDLQGAPQESDPADECPVCMDTDNFNFSQFRAPGALCRECRQPLSAESGTEAPRWKQLRNLRAYGSHAGSLTRWTDGAVADVQEMERGIQSYLAANMTGNYGFHMHLPDQLVSGQPDYHSQDLY
jgi:hypothetical protein